MADNNRLDLDSDLDKMATDLLSDVQEATEELKKRHAANKAKDERNAKRAQSTKSSAVVIAIATVVIVLLAYWLVFAKSNDSAGTGTPVHTTQAPVVIKSNATIPRPATHSTPVTPGIATRGRTGNRDPQVVNHPSNDYDNQPSGM